MRLGWSRVECGRWGGRPQLRALSLSSFGVGVLGSCGGSIDGPLSLGVRVAGLSRPLPRRAGTRVRGLRSACRPWVACGLGSESGGLGAPQAVLGA